MSLKGGLPLALLVLRVSLVVFFAVWMLEKFVRPESTVAITEAFYGLPLTTGVVYAIGTVQAVLLVLFATGVARVFSYGFFMLIHAVSMLVSYEPLLRPFEGSNHLFHAGIPALGALIALFLLRDEDRLLTLGSRP